MRKKQRREVLEVIGEEIFERYRVVDRAVLRKTLITMMLADDIEVDWLVERLYGRAMITTADIDDILWEYNKRRRYVKNPYIRAPKIEYSHQELRMLLRRPKWLEEVENNLWSVKVAEVRV